MSITVTFEGTSHADIVGQVKEWLATVEPEDRLSYTEAVEQGAELTKDALRVIASAAPTPVADNELVKALTDMDLVVFDREKVRSELNKVQHWMGEMINSLAEKLARLNLKYADIQVERSRDEDLDEK